MTAWLDRLNHLPREARDTLFLLVVIGWIIAPQFDHLPVWCSAMAAVLLVLRGVLAVRNQSLPSRWWLLVLLVLASAATYASHRTLLGRDAGVTSIVVLLSLKTLEMRGRRDAFVVFFLGFFTLLSNFFFSQSLLTAAAMLVGLLGLLTALVNAHMPVGRPPLLEAARTAGWMALLGAPIMAVLFVLFPRVAPLWGLPSDALVGRSGLSERMEVGTIAELALDDSIAFRVRFAGRPPSQAMLYFRGPVLSRFDGRRWEPADTPMNVPPRLEAALQVQGEAVDYEVTLEPSQRPWLMVLEATPERPRLPGVSMAMTPDLQWVADHPLTELARYRARSYPQFRHGPTRMTAALSEMAQLPAGSNPRTRSLASELREQVRSTGASGSNSQALVDAALQRLRTGGYTYTLEPGIYGTHTADEFWFDRKAGFCEHIASSFVVLMRALGIPARVVTGYQGGTLNGLDGYWTVRQSDAHAWAEVWFADRGWVRVDPTTAVAPGRTGDLRLAPPRNAVAQVLATVSPQINLGLRAVWDAVNNRWNQWVLNYTQDRQLQLLQNLGFESPSWEDLGTVLLVLLIGASTVGAAWTQWERHHQDPWLRLLRRAAQRLRRAGLPVANTPTPRQLAQLLAARAPSQPGTDAIAHWLLELEAWRYGASTGTAHTAQRRQQLATLQRRYHQLPWPTRNS